MRPASVLRSMVLDDLPIVLGWRNHPEVQRYMYTQHEITSTEHRLWFKRLQESPLEHPLVLEAGAERLGYARIHIVDQLAGRAEWGFYRAPEAPRGTGSDLCASVLQHAFGQLGLHKIWGEVVSTNEPSVALHRKLGFREEARLRDHYFDGDKYQDSLGFGLLESEWCKNLGVQ
ncbi:UDP-4-amino-4,6-dideoxy-N-acetyl-beta-L-altrosamine N-acetyltransferase [Arthrobacter pigmenti]